MSLIGRPDVKRERTEVILRPDGTTDLYLVVETYLSLTGRDDDALADLIEAADEHELSRPGTPHTVRIVRAA